MGEIADTLVRGYMLGAQDDDEAFDLGFWDEEPEPKEDDRFVLIEWEGDEGRGVYYSPEAVECWGFAIDCEACVLSTDGRPALKDGWTIEPIPQNGLLEEAA